MSISLDDGRYSYKGSIYFNQKAFRDEGADAAWVRPLGLQPRHDTLPLFGQTGEHPVTMTVRELVP